MKLVFEPRSVLREDDGVHVERERDRRITELADVTTGRIEQYKAHKIAAGLSPKTVNNRLTILRKCLATALEWDELSSLPRFRFLKVQQREPRWLTEEELQRILAALEDPVFRSMALVAARTGLRFSELAGLAWSDIRFPDRRLGVQQTSIEGHADGTKNYRCRFVPLTADALSVLASLERAAGLVFLRDGRAINQCTARWHLVRAAKKAAIKQVGWHTFRHTFASHLVSKGASLKAVQELLGHATMTMTLRYAHLAPEVLRDTIDLLEPSGESGQQVGTTRTSDTPFGERVRVPPPRNGATQTHEHPLVAGVGAGSP